MDEVLDIFRISIKKQRMAIAEAMATPFPGGYGNIPGTWPVGSSENVSGTTFSSDIPEEWQRANEALQEVQQQSSKSSLTSAGTASPIASPKTNKQPPVVTQHQLGPMGYPITQHQQYWTTTPMYHQCFPGYPGYVGNYNYCPMPYRNGYEAYQHIYGHGMTPQPPVSAVATNTSELQNSELPDSSRISQLQPDDNQPPPPLPPPPPPPAPPAEEEEDDDEKSSKISFSPRNKQAPGSGGIRFSIPQRKAQQGNSLLSFKNKKRADNSNKPQNTNAFYHDMASSDEESNDNIMNNDFSLSHRRNENQESEDPANRMSNSSKEMRRSKNNPAINQTLRDYVRRCFEKCVNNQEKDEMSDLIRKKTFGHTDEYENTIDPGIDWSLEPLPLLSREQNHFESRDSHMNANLPGSKNITPSRTPPPSNQYSGPRNFRMKRGSYQNQRQTPRKRYQMHSRSRSRSPVSRRVVRKHFSSGSESPDSSRGSSGKQSLNSSVVEPENRSRNNSHSASAKKKKNKKKNKLAFTVDSEFSSSEKLQKRAARFDLSGNKKCGGSIFLTINNPSAGMDDSSDIDWSTFAIVGTCQDIEKPFLRITSAVDPATIRPEEVLYESLKVVKRHWTENQDYHFACEQLKSIRQDLVVQCIRNEFTIHAYETHARIALEKGDHTEFNQCQSQLKVLYDEVKNGSNKLEFVGYRILYNMFTEDTREIKNIIANLSADEKKNQVICHSLKLVQAWILNSYHVFFKLYVSAPKMSGFLIDWFVVKIRKAALKTYIKAYRPSIPVPFLHKELGFSSLEETLAFLQEVQCILSSDKSTLLTKESNSAAL